MSTRRRRSYVSKPNFQIKLTIIFMLMVTIVANLVGGMCYWLISEKFHNLVAQAPDDFAEITTNDVAQFLLPKILFAQGVSLLIVFVLSMLVTHTIAGPVYRMERVAREIGAGDLTGKTKLRPRDELKELADAFNVMTEGLVEKIRIVREEVAACEDEVGNSYDFTAMTKALYSFELPEDSKGELDDSDVDEADDTDKEETNSDNDKDSDEEVVT